MGEQKLVDKLRDQFSYKWERERERWGDRERGRGRVMQMLFNNVLMLFSRRLSALLHFTMWIGFYL